ncbi:helix-turn-helix domain-containing protein [Streptomyces tendae]|uniref:Helix-turn-helix domain-containing protein n=1 Tax=Streptomyces tendae TaxID=1932 RepID=A0ABX5ZQR0_STRTE|nr:helix-turn-helix transcriptional regulator [Streptomyces tendae]QER86876.1 helix-turn-helix domain-containing protein [Streptomyces tendae]
MTTVTSGTASRTEGVGPLLRAWRQQRRVSQLELALRADSSARHISFIETGPSRPSEEMVLRLAEHLEVPVRERNALLLRPVTRPLPGDPLDDPALEVVRAGIERLIGGFEPYPALVVDAMYDVVAANRGVLALFDGVPEALLTPPLNAVRLTLHPRGLAPRIRNLREWRGHLLEQMRRNIALRRSERLRALYDEVAAYPVPDTACPEEPAEPVAYFALPMVIEHRGRTLSFVSSISTFNTPMDVTVAELAVETLLPADPATAEYLQTWLS